MSRDIVVRSFASAISAIAAASVGQPSAGGKASDIHTSAPRDAAETTDGSAAAAANAEVEGTVRQAIARYGRAQVAMIPMSGPLHDLGIDLLGLVKIVMDVERRFDIELRPDEVLSWLTPADIAHTVEAALSA
jgi:acyl carrier protein